MVSVFFKTDICLVAGDIIIFILVKIFLQFCLLLFTFMRHISTLCSKEVFAWFYYEFVHQCLNLFLGISLKERDYRSILFN